MKRHRQRSTPFDDTAVSALGAGMHRLSDADREALRHLSVIHRFVGRGRNLIREGDAVGLVRVLCKGWAIRSRRLDKARRQILDVALPGDILGLHVDGAGASICDVEALTACEIGEIDANALERVAYHNRGVASGLFHCLSRQLTQASDQTMRLGRMTAYERLCSFLLDIHARQRQVALRHGRVDFPITQGMLADMLGLSAVHVNRQIMRLRREGLVTLERRQLTIHDERRLSEVACFRDRRNMPRAPAFFAAE